MYMQSACGDGGSNSRRINSTYILEILSDIHSHFFRLNGRRWKQCGCLVFQLSVDALIDFASDYPQSERRRNISLVCLKNCAAKIVRSDGCSLVVSAIVAPCFSSTVACCLHQYTACLLFCTLADRQRPLRLLESSGIIKVIAGPFRFSSKHSHSQRTNKQYRHYGQAISPNVDDRLKRVRLFNQSYRWCVCACWFCDAACHMQLDVDISLL